MRIIHCSDLHLDADLRTKYDAASAAERRAELLDSFRRLCRYAREEDVSAVLICGDLFDTAAPSPSAVRTVEDLILGNSDILFFYLRGNHDERPVLLNLQDLIAAASGDVQPEALAQSVADKEVVTCCEVGNGIVPLDPGERAWREQVGRTLNILSERADRVVRMVCGIPVTLK